MVQEDLLCQSPCYMGKLIKDDRERKEKCTPDGAKCFHSLPYVRVKIHLSENMKNKYVSQAYFLIFIVSWCLFSLF